MKKVLIVLLVLASVGAVADLVKAPVAPEVAKEKTVTCAEWNMGQTNINQLIMAAAAEEMTRSESRTVARAIEKEPVALGALIIVECNSNEYLADAMYKASKRML